MQTKLATVISRLFDPMPTTVLIGLVGIFATPMSRHDRLFWLFLIGAIGTLIGLILGWFIRRGYVFDARLTPGDDLHRDRLGILWIGNGLLLVAIGVSTALGRQEPLWTILLAMTLVLVLATLITTRYKVSLHMVGVTSLVTILFIQSATFGLATLALIPLVAWARRVLHRHTLGQLVIGSLVSLSLVLTTFALTGQLGVDR